MAKLDKIDKKILYFLIENCRHTNSSLSKKLKISDQMVKYRIEKLEKMGVINKYIVSTMRNSLGVFRYFIVYLQVKKTKAAEKKAILEYLEKHPLVIKLFESDGIWNVGFEISAAMQFDVKPLLDELQRISKGHIEDLKVFNIAMKQFLERKPFLEGIDTSKLKVPVRSDTSFQKELVKAKNTFQHGVAKLDKIDLKILSAMRHNARMPLYKLAEEIKGNVNTVKKHIKDMIKRGIIKQFTIDVDYSKIGFRKGLIFLSVLSDEKSQKQIIKHVEGKYPHVAVVFNYLDYWNLGFEVQFKDIDEMDVIIDDILANFNDVVTNYNKLIVVRDIKTDSYNKNVKEVYERGVSLLGII